MGLILLSEYSLLKSGKQSSAGNMHLREETWVGGNKKERHFREIEFLAYYSAGEKLL